MPKILVGKVLGPQGPQGEKGSIGERGPQGLQGLKGESGLTVSINGIVHDETGNITITPEDIGAATSEQIGVLSEETHRYIRVGTIELVNDANIRYPYTTCITGAIAQAIGLANTYHDVIYAPNADANGYGTQIFMPYADAGIIYRRSNGLVWSKFIDHATKDQIDISFPYASGLNQASAVLRAGISKVNNLVTVYIACKKIDGSDFTSKHIIGTLPPGYRPSLRHSEVIRATDGVTGEGIASCEIKNTGDIEIILLANSPIPHKMFIGELSFYV